MSAYSEEDVSSNDFVVSQETVDLDDFTDHDVDVENLSDVDPDTVQ